MASKPSPGKALEGVPLLAIEVFRRYPSPFAWMAGSAYGKRGKTLAEFEMPFRASHVAIEKVRPAPTPDGLMDLLRSLLPALKVSSQQTTVRLAWAEVLLRACKDDERFVVDGQEMDRYGLAELLLEISATLRRAPPFSWILPYLESLLALGPSMGNSSISLDRASAALVAAIEAEEPVAIRAALTRVRDTAESGCTESRPQAPPPKSRSALILRRDGHCLRIGDAVVSLTPREFTLLWTTAEGETLPRTRAVELLAKERSLSGAAIPGVVEEGALQAHRRSILTKVEKSAGKRFRDRLAKAFRSEKRIFVYDAAVLPFTVE